MKILVVGGVAAGASAATKARRTSEEAEITIFEKGDYISYANCGMPYYIGGVIEDREELLIVTPEYLKRRFNIDVRTGAEVIKILPENKKILVKDHKSGLVYEEGYDRLVIATGATPILPSSFKGENVFTLYTLKDMDRLKNYIELNSPKKALILGGGFIGIEIAENFLHLGMDVTICEKADQILLPFDKEMAKIVEEYLSKASVNLLKGKGVEKIEDSIAYFEDGTSMSFDIAVVSLGVRPNSLLAREAGIELGLRDAIKVNKFMETSVKDIYAAGDCCENYYHFNNKSCWIPLAGSANKQGRIAGYNAVSKDNKKTYQGTLGTAIAKFKDLSFGSVGYNEKTLRNEGQDYMVFYLKESSHASYYPGYGDLYIKVLGTKEGKILGAQVVGSDGVDKRVDLFATALFAGLSFEDLESLDLAYAPPFSSAKDPVIVAGMVGNNICKDRIKTITDIEKESIILDVRTEGENKRGTISGAINIPIDQIRGRIGEINHLKDKKINIFCASGYRSYIVTRMLSNLGFKDVSNLTGGYFFYKKREP